MDKSSAFSPRMFKVRAKKFQQEYDLWTEALASAKLRIPKCGWFEEIQILEQGDLVWAYSRGYKYPRFIGPGTYDRLARRFALENRETPPDAVTSTTEDPATDA